jgi:hypothetical protein
MGGIFQACSRKKYLADFLREANQSEGYAGLVVPPAID